MSRETTRNRSATPARRVVAVLALVFALWALTLAFVPPAGEFPLNDDWIYARAVKDWSETGHYAGHPFSTANLVGQAAWGRLFCELFGFSHTALRWSTLVLWLLAAWATSLAALGLRANFRAAALAGCLIVANPIAMNLGYTFMTDVPFMALMAIAGLFFLRAMDEPRWHWFLLGSLFGASGLLVRQFAVLVPFALFIALCPWDSRWRRREAFPLLAAFGLPWVAAGALLLYLPSYAAELGHTWDPSVLGQSTGERVFGGFKFYAVALTCLGLFSLPLALAPVWHWLWHKEGVWQRRAIGLGLVLVPLFTAVYGANPNRIPFLGNILYDVGTGPMTLRGIFMGSYLWRPFSIGAWWWIPTVLGLLVAGWMLAGSIRWFILIPGDGRRPVTDARRRQQCFLMIWAVLMIAALYHPWLPVRFDRYFLGALVPVVLLLAMAPAGTRKVPVYAEGAAFVLLYAFSLVCVQDYMAWNSTRWAMLDRLMNEQGVPPEQIDGGYEFNGWYTSPGYIAQGGAGAFLQSGPIGWWVVEDNYAISWLPRPGFEKVEEVPYDSWLAGDKGKLLLLKKKPGEAGEPRD